MAKQKRTQRQERPKRARSPELPKIGARNACCPSQDWTKIGQGMCIKKGSRQVVEASKKFCQLRTKQIQARDRHAAAGGAQGTHAAKGRVSARADIQDEIAKSRKILTKSQEQRALSGDYNPFKNVDSDATKRAQRTARTARTKRRPPSSSGEDKEKKCTCD